MIVAAPASGAGKTVVTLGLLRRLRDRGARAGAFKVGPDYIDPAFHAAATGRACGNLDPWAMRPATLATAWRRAAADADIVIGEGVMGLFDGARGGAGSTASLAETLRLPVLLVIDARGQGASAAAVIEGFARHRRGVTVAGVVVNRIAGERHARLIREACAMPPLGFVPRHDALSLPERHLGLVQATEHPDLEAFLDRAARIVGEAIDEERLVALAREPHLADAPPPAPPPVPSFGRHVAVASDAAFRFVYDHWRAAWKSAGTRVSPFSPLANEPPHPNADSVYLPGGYPELHAGPLAAATGFRDGLRAAASRGAIVYGECGGYMTLGEGLIDRAGRRHAMAGLLPLETSFAAPRLHLGYRLLAPRADGPFGPAGSEWRGHEFHYAAAVREDRRRADALFDRLDSGGDSATAIGLRRGRVCGAFCHLIDRAEAAAGAASRANTQAPRPPMTSQNTRLAARAAPTKEAARSADTVPPWP